MKKRHAIRFAPLLLCAAPLTMRADVVIAPGSTVMGHGIDDENISTTIDAAYITDPSVIIGYFGLNYVVAGAPGPAAGIAPIPPSDFSVPVYQPWVVNNNPDVNNILAPNGHNYNRGVTNQDAGGADFLLNYTPSFGNPTTINFIQIFKQNTNGAGFGPEELDNFGSTTVPYYNQGGHAAGVGVITGINPLIVPPGGSAWLLDIPYRCENGPPPYTETTNCQIGADDTLLSQVQIFQTWIESPTDIDGTMYNVLYGGIQWGYEYFNFDTPVPEPSSVILLATILATVSAKLHRRRGKIAS